MTRDNAPSLVHVNHDDYFTCLLYHLPSVPLSSRYSVPRRTHSPQLSLLLPAAQGAASPVSLLTMLGPTALQTVAGLGALLLADRLIMKRIFEVRVWDSL